MNYFFTIILIFFHVFLIVVISDNPTSIVQPYDGPDPGYILAESNGGLANRLRVLASYMYIAMAKFDGAHLVFIWDKNEACPGHFLSIFEPLDKVIFATNTSRYVLDKKAKVVYENSYAVMHWILSQNGIPKNKFGFPTWREIEYKMYSLFYPIKEIMLQVSAFVRSHDICNCSAMHLRTTDLDKIMGEKKHLNIKSFMKFVESRPSEEKVYLLTDNPDIQNLFIDKYPSKIIFFKRMDPVDRQLPLFIRNTRTDLFPSFAAAADRRFSGIDHTLIDVLIASHAKTFKPAPYSSLSELVKMFEVIGKRDRGWC